MNILEQLKMFLETNGFENIKVLNFNADLTKELVNQVLIRDLPPDREPKNYNRYDKIGFAVKNQNSKTAKELCQNIEYLFSQMRGGKAIDRADFIAFNAIINKQSTTYIPSGQSVKENTYIYQTQFEFVYQDKNLFHQFN